MTGSPPSGSVSSRLARILLAVTLLLLGAVVALGYGVWRLSTAEVTLGQLSEDQRIQLLRSAQQIAPPVYEHFLGSGEPGFYTMQPNTRYDRSHPNAGRAGVLGDEFTTNELGFRTVPTPKPRGVRRIVVVGDSWTFGPGVRREDTFTHRLQELLAETRTEGEEEWETYDLGIMGWNTENELSALQILEERLQPDLVVMCPTSNDIDDSFGVWNGRLVNSGFQSSAIFRHSYEYERRWVESFRALDSRAKNLAARGIPTLVYFLAEWRGLAPYYAKLAGFTTPYTVVPTEFILAPYRLATEFDAGRHANVEGHRELARYLYNALVELKLIGSRTPLPTPHEVRFPGFEYDPEEVRKEFAMWQGFGITRDLIPLDQGYMGREALFEVDLPDGARTLELELELADLDGPYPLEIEASILAPIPATATRTAEQYTKTPLRIQLEIPTALAAYDFLDLRLHFDKVVSAPGSVKPRTLLRPKVHVY